MCPANRPRSLRPAPRVSPDPRDRSGSGTAYRPQPVTALPPHDIGADHPVAVFRPPQSCRSRGRCASVRARRLTSALHRAPTPYKPYDGTPPHRDRTDFSFIDMSEAPKGNGDTHINRDIPGERKSADDCGASHLTSPMGTMRSDNLGIQQAEHVLYSAALQPAAPASW